ncbi:tRNA nucleotidyltransferase/poly(A) polymerase [Rubripirellula obstinata]|uniref:tRNA nucleotidyltransferase/poly(A) polymerase n=2 Tax=Rubripirellula obstinata TaxID=406547 RepID=A0A5B1CIV0_9BACT|nr:tRNA nucleotidyltransferase/poly(A) polymerase [Rubripirellula obstinata]
MFDQQRSTNRDAAEAFRIMSVLAEAGFVAHLAGGCVRDALLGKTPKDYDVATDATPESVREVFGKSHTLAFGASFGVIGVLPIKSANQNRDAPLTPTEVATFRSDGQYSDGRRPDSVHYGNAEQDALRRDFTINGLFYDPISESVIDYVGGQADLKSKVLRTIGSPHQRFAEDKLRMLRAIRFATTLGFQVDPATTDAIEQHAADISVVSGERIGAEMRRVMTSEHSADGLRRLVETGLAQHVMPGLLDIDFDRLTRLRKHLPCDSFAAALACVAIAGEASHQILLQTSRDWKLSSEETRQATAAVKHHATLIRAAELPWSKIQPVLIDRDRDVVVSVATAVATADDDDQTGLEKVRGAIRWPADRLNPPPLITGDDLREHGIPAGPMYRIVLQTVRDGQLEGEISTADQAWEVVKHVLSKKRT